MIESDALRLVVDAAGLRTSSTFSPGIPRMIATLDAQPLEVQQALIERAAERFTGRDETIPNSHFIATCSRSPNRNAGTGQASAVNAAGRTTTPRPSTETRHRSR
ncbi:hypothetical protein [Streptomyces sp. NPDC048637]|uniref:hypothetical protein n=1 Tax=Streptomyces sp. NPDC048637 TaxID=3155636 RepID=UPI00342CDB9C